MRALRRPSNTDAAYPIHATEDDLVQLIQTYGAEQRLDEIKRILAHTGDLELELDGAYVQKRIVHLELEATLGKSVPDNNEIEE